MKRFYETTVLGPGGVEVHILAVPKEIIRYGGLVSNKSYDDPANLVTSLTAVLDEELPTDLQGFQPLSLEEKPLLAFLDAARSQARRIEGVDGRELEDFVQELLSAPELVPVRHNPLLLCSMVSVAAATPAAAAVGSGLMVLASGAAAAGALLVVVFAKEFVKAVGKKSGEEAADVVIPAVKRGFKKLFRS